MGTQPGAFAPTIGSGPIGGFGPVSPMDNMIASGPGGAFGDPFSGPVGGFGSIGDPFAANVVLTGGGDPMGGLYNSINPFGPVETNENFQEPFFFDDPSLYTDFMHEEPSSEGSGTADVVINEIAPFGSIGFSTGPPIDWIELYNKGTASVDLTGWKLVDNHGVNDASSVYTIPSGTSLGPGQFLVLDKTNHFRFDLDSGYSGTADRASLFNPTNQEISTTGNYNYGLASITYARLADDSYSYTHKPTPNAINMDSSVLFGDSSANTITGTSNDDYIFAFEGDDAINGGAGNDVIMPGEGADSITGGTGNDWFYYPSKNHAGDSITDFGVSGGQDKIVVGHNNPVSAFTRSTIEVDSAALGSTYNIATHSNQLPTIFNFTANTANATSATGMATQFSSFLVQNGSSSLSITEQAFVVAGNGTHSYVYHWEDTDKCGTFYGEATELTLVTKLDNFNNDSLTGTEFSFETIL